MAEQPGGIFTIGGTNTSLYNDTLNYVLLSESKSGHWDIPLDNVSVNGKNLSISSAGVVIDTGTCKFGKFLFKTSSSTLELVVKAD